MLIFTERNTIRFFFHSTVAQIRTYPFFVRLLFFRLTQSRIWHPDSPTAHSVFSQGLELKRLDWLAAIVTSLSWIVTGIVIKEWVENRKLSCGTHQLSDIMISGQRQAAAFTLQSLIIKLQPTFVLPIQFLLKERSVVLLLSD